MKTKTIKTKPKKEEPNKLVKLVINLTSPIKMDQELTFAQIGVLVGQNDTGKTFVLKLMFALGALGQMRNMPPDVRSAAQFVLDNTFDDQKFDGAVAAIFTKGRVSVSLQEGKVLEADVEGEIIPAVFMSTDMRTFDQMGLYLRMRKESAGTDALSFMRKMLEAYRLYDFTYMEALLAKLPFRLPEQIKSSLATFDFKESIVLLEVNKDKCVFNAVMDDGKRKNLATYGKGHQSLLNMMLGLALRT